MTFAFQFGRVEAGHLTWRFLVEFLGSQLVLATPAIFVAMAVGLVTARPSRLPTMVVAFVAPAIVYFLVHSLHDRVQGNWPCFLYPPLSVAAAAVLSRHDPANLIVWTRRLAVPVAFALLLGCYAQALFQLLPLGRGDPFARLLGDGFDNVAKEIRKDQRATGARAILTTDYATTAWVAFYAHLPVIQLNEEDRWLAAPPPSADLLSGALLYVTEQKRDQHALVMSRFETLSPLPAIFRKAQSGAPVDQYAVYRASGFRGAAAGRAPLADN
jgi:hypothetical protein